MTKQQFMFGSGIAVCLMPFASPGLALALGIAIAGVFGSPLGRAGGAVARWLLQACVILLGFGMNLPVLLRAGLGGAGFAALTIVITLGAGYFLGRWMRLRWATSLLISAGTAICGGSAIAAVGSTIGADEADMTVAMGSVFIFNALALYLFPIIGHLLHLSQDQFGLWAGVAIHDVSSVVGAAARFGPGALQTATAVKLSRSLWIVPVTLALAVSMKAGGRSRAAKVPWFIGLFIFASMVRSVFPEIGAFVPVIAQVSTRGLTLALFLMGSGLSFDALRSVGWRAIAQAASLWVLISGLSLAVILRM